MRSIKIATWNVNSINKRIEIVCRWLQEHRIDVLMLQEIKCITENFPIHMFYDIGYEYILVKGEKGYNGVSIVAKYPLELCSTTLLSNDQQARYIEGLAILPEEKLRLINIYVPNGQNQRFAYKLAFLDHLYSYLKFLLQREKFFIIGGDYNVAPFAIDVYDHEKLDGTVCFHYEERLRLRKMFNLHLVDAFRVLYPYKQEFTWWDYRGHGWQYNHGMRLDHLLLSPHAADQLIECTIHKQERGQQNSSDHVPIVCELQLSDQRI